MARLVASARAQGSAHRTWVGVDGVQREVLITYSPPVPTANIVFLPAGAALVGTGYAGYAADGGTINGSQPPGADSGSTMAANGAALNMATASPPSGPVDSSGGATGSPTQSTSVNPVPDSNQSVAVVSQAICRHMQETATVGGTQDQADELECRDSNGDWSPAIRQADLAPLKSGTGPNGA